MCYLVHNSLIRKKITVDTLTFAVIVQITSYFSFSLSSLLFSNIVIWIETQLCNFFFQIRLTYFEMCSSSRSSGFFRSEIFISKLRTPPLLSYVLRLLSCSPKRETLRFETTALNSHSHWCSCCCCCSLEKVAPSALKIFYLPF